MGVLQTARGKMKKFFALIFLCFFLISCLQPTPVPLESTEPSMQEDAETPTSEQTLEPETGKAKMTPEELRDLLESGYFKDESNKPKPTEVIQSDETDFVEVPKSEPTTGASLLSKCIQICIKNGEVDGADKKTMEFLPSACSAACGNIAMYGGEERLLTVIKHYEESIKFHQNFNAGLYDKDIEQCKTWKTEAITAKNEHWHFQSNYAEAHQTKIDDNTLRVCEQSVKDWVLEQKQEKPLGIEFKEEADSIKDKERKVTDECYPTMYEYKRLVFTKRNELDQHNLEKESISDCLLRVIHPEFYDYIEGLKKGIPNWQ